MVRGQHSLHTQFFGNTTVAPKEKQRPRNFFMPERNQLLVHRYYFYAEIKGYRYDKCLTELEQDMFITETRLSTVLTECMDLLRQIMQTKPTLKQLQRQFPRLNWNL